VGEGQKGVRRQGEYKEAKVVVKHICLACVVKLDDVAVTTSIIGFFKLTNWARSFERRRHVASRTDLREYCATIELVRSRSGREE